MRVWPADYDSDCYVLLPVPVATIPIIAGKIYELADRDEWASDSDWLQGYQFVACLLRCLVECGQSFSETMSLIAIALGANEIDEADLSPAFPALAARLAAARAADSAGVLAKKELKASPSDIIRISELLKPFVEDGDDSSGEINIWRMLRSTWNFGAFWSTDMQQTQGVEKSVQEVGALLAVMAGLQERPISDVKDLFPYLGPELEAAQGRDVALNSINQILPKETGNNKFSRVVRFTELTRVLQGEFPSTWWTWLGLGDVDYPQLWDLYRLQAAGSEIKVTVDGQEKTLWDYLTDAVGLGADAIDIVTDIAESAVSAGSEVAGATIEGAGLVMQAGLIGAIVGLSGQLATMQQNQVNANTNRVNEHLRTMNVLGGQAAMDNPQTLSGSSIFGNLNNLLQGSQLSDGRVNLWSLLQKQNTLETKFDALLQGSDLGGGRVNLWALDQRINDVIIELQSGQIFSKFSLLLQNSPAAGAVNLYELWQEIYKIIKNDNDPNVVNFEDVKDGLDEINKRLGWLMGDPDHPLPSDNLTDLYDLLLQLQCICQTNRKYLPLILGNMPDEVPIIIDDGDGIIAPPATTTPAPANICQLARWFFSKIRYVITNMCATSAPSRSTLALLYFAHFNVDIPQEYVVRLTTMINSYVNSSEAHNHLAMLDYLNGLENELICALYDAANSASAKGAWDTLMDSKGAEALAAPTIVKHSVWNGLLTELYEGNIPRNPADLIGYSSDCSGCSGGTGGGGNIYNIDMVRYSLTDRGAAPYAVPDPPDGDDQTWYFLVWQPDMRVWQSTGDDWDGVIAYKSNTSGTITGWPTLPDLTPFISNGAGMSGWSIKCNYDQSQNPDPLYDVYFAPDPDNVDDLEAGTLITTTWQPLPATGRVCVYCKGGLNGANQWLLIQLQAP